MNAIHSAKPENARHQPEPAAMPGHFAKVTALVVMAAGLILWASPPTALVAGILFALLIGHPFAALESPCHESGCCKFAWCCWVSA